MRLGQHSQTILSRGLLTALAILFSVAAQAAMCERAYTIRVTKNFPPYYMTDESGTHSGLEVQFARMVMKAAGCEFRLVIRPWRRALLQLEMGDLDILGVASRTPEREVYSHFSTPYRREVVGLAVRRMDLNREIKSLEDLARMNLSAVYLRGAYHGPNFANFEKTEAHDKAFRPVTTVFDSVIALQKERIDAILTDMIAMSIYFDDQGLDDVLAVHDYVEYENNVHFMLSRKSVSDGEVHMINAAIQQVLANPENPFARWLPK
ncbi:substrate-binding periplasmic protein [Aestuariispira insulae]|uniref:ABC-type amino acid transport substrate-binding protein n=1 Tax=Aestuariispira insulae TaxID=1461337 RepID=A0A3D9HRQ3_9PROT|nr:transporter substrate-binding domain-containing protein [Aestuariispira insulae]RED52150.1 ABC-type amino acid transport substrate-binding protein [Aestuariispira insulae]